MQLLRERFETATSFVQRHDGRVFNTAGDALLAEFASPVEAVRCALEIQEAMQTANALVPETDRLVFRIGINQGDVIVNGTDLLGDGVNVAARLESLASPGGICVSSNVYEQLVGELTLGAEDLGPQHVKNIPRPIHAYRLTPEGARPAAAAPGAAWAGRPSGAWSCRCWASWWRWAPSPSCSPSGPPIGRARQRRRRRPPARRSTRSFRRTSPTSTTAPRMRSARSTRRRGLPRRWPSPAAAISSPGSPSRPTRRRRKRQRWKNAPRSFGA